MTIQSIDPPKKNGVFASKPMILWAAFCVMLVFYSFLVWDSGFHMMPIKDIPNEAQLLAEIAAKSDLHVPYAEVAEDAMKVYPLWNNLTAMLTGTYFGFGSNGNTDPLLHYVTMEPVEQSVLSLQSAARRGLPDPRHIPVHTNVSQNVPQSASCRGRSLYRWLVRHVLCFVLPSVAHSL